MTTLISLVAAMVFAICGCNYSYAEMRTFDTEADKAAYETVVESLHEEGYGEIEVVRDGENDYHASGIKQTSTGYEVYYVVFECYNGKVHVVKEIVESHYDETGDVVVLERPWYGGHPADAWILKQDSNV